MKRTLVIFFPVLAIAICELIALLAWTGPYVGPALALLASIMPTRSSIPTKKAA